MEQSRFWLQSGRRIWLCFVDFAFKYDYIGVAGAESSSGVSYSFWNDVPSGSQTLSYESSDDEDLTKEALIQAHRLLHFKWVELIKVNEKLSSQAIQSNM